MDEKTIDIPIKKKVKFKIGKIKPFDFDCDHPNADKINGVWVCGFCYRELDENMNEINNTIEQTMMPTRMHGIPRR